MKTKYILVPDVVSMSADSVIYYIWVGTSKRDQRLLGRLERYAAANNMWFEKWGEHVAQRVAYYNAKVFHFDGYFVNRFKVVSQNISEILPIITGSDRDIFEANVLENKGMYSFLCGLFHVPENVENSLRNRTLALCQKRKYLSLANTEELTDTAIKVGLISALFVLASWLQSIEHYYY